MNISIYKTAKSLELVKVEAYVGFIFSPISYCTKVSFCAMLYIDKLYDLLPPSILLYKSYLHLYLIKYYSLLFLLLNIFILKQIFILYYYYHYA